MSISQTKLLQADVTKNLLAITSDLPSGERVRRVRTITMEDLLCYIRELPDSVSSAGAAGLLFQH